jgi:hypothetical protein
MSATAEDLPTYIKNENQERYNTLFNQIITDWFNSSGFFLPTLTNAQVAALVAITPAIPACRVWFNSNLGKMQILVAPGTVETVTSA